MNANDNGALLYEGPSAYDGTPIVALVTGLRRHTRNEKTGRMLQTWILPAERLPSAAVTTGHDSAVCGACPERPTSGGRCYVEAEKAPDAVWRSYARGAYFDATEPEVQRALGRGRKVRLGAYGDPVAVPVAVWERLTSESLGWTGYSHHPDPSHPIFDLCQFSASSYADALKAWFHGRRTFRILAKGETLEPGELWCPNVTHDVQCADCGLCNGTHGVGIDKRRSIAIRSHGVRAAGSHARLPVLA